MDTYNSLMQLAALRVIGTLEASKEQKLLKRILYKSLTEEELRRVINNFPIDLQEEDITSYADYELELLGEI